MTQEFDNVRASFAASIPGRTLSALQQTIESAWRTSLFGSAMRATGRRASATNTIRTIAIGVAVASLSQPLLMWMMPRTVRPSMPLFVFVVIGLAAIAAARHPDAIALGWPQSRLARRLRR